MPSFIAASELAPALHGSVVTIGNFDGVHRGHQVLVSAASADAQRRGLPSIALTFEPHPATFFGRRDPSEFRIQSSEERALALKRCGISQVVTADFGAELASLTAEEFVSDVLHKTLHAAAVHVGHDFTFGRGRSGTCEILERLGAAVGMSVIVHAQHDVDGVVASSTRLREALRSGDLISYERIAGRRYTIVGEVESGAGRGRTIGIPTLNVYPALRLLPPRGVYATRLHIDGKQHDAISNLGIRPTFAGDPRVSLETHVLSDGFVATSRHVEVEFVAFIRPERRFDGPQELVAQIATDTNQARAALLAAS